MLPLPNLSDSKVARGFVVGHRGRKLVAALLWKAFPSKSADELAERAAPVLGLSERHIKRLLKGEHSVNADVAFAVLALAGFEAGLSLIFDR